VADAGPAIELVGDIGPEGSGKALKSVSCGKAETVEPSSEGTGAADLFFFRLSLAPRLLYRFCFFFFLTRMGWEDKAVDEADTSPPASCGSVACEGEVNVTMAGTDPVEWRDEIFSEGPAAGESDWSESSPQ
jgi:hypothetical protein